MRRAAEHSLALGPRPVGVSLQQWLHAALCEAMRDGRLPAGSRLPTSRSLARDHGVSRSTVTAVFERLLADGYISAHVGRGSFVAPQVPPASAPEAAAQALAPALSRRGRQMSEAGAGVRSRNGPLPRTFEADRVDTGLFPSALWTRLAAKRLRWSEGRIAQGVEWQGLAPLRELLAQQLALSRGIRCEADQVVIVPGTRQALDLLARLLLNPGEDAWVEDPGSPAVQALLTAAGARVVPVPVDDQGLDVDAALGAAPRARLAYTTCAAQMPLGHAMSASRRAALLAWARTACAYVIDEDRDADFVFDGSGASALKAEDDGDCVIHLGSLAFSMAPCLRLAYLVLPRRLVEPVCRTLALTQSQPSLLDQAVLHDFIADGHWARHLRELRLVYGARADALRHGLDKHFGRWLQFTPSRRGLNLTAWLPASARDAELARRAAAAGVVVTPLTAYRLQHPAPAGLRLGFAAFTEASIRSGVHKLAQALP
ncbi:GntR family transcriptional regulator/MocR family aminotransferase [Pelomonas saccharophila]|uniref:GntR family transcriptional regulator/MocR family aminotransferase n=1 Tax=Roseateles saccharophilus TaxID=304 RepID=A0ABU1YS32_ROSSA|nr:PLP-dependent aminotransferase family protein [Roseateles saccharophilus]MDR7271543.1 GntR family transcriptional regulator/MocR family aminotransferase [Roseateles saccharophilus]